MTSYLHAGDDGKPRRVTDVIDQRTWCNSAVFADVFRDRGGRYQLSLVTSLDHGVGKGWVLLRDKRDFSLADLQTANLVLPQVVCLAEMAKLKSQLIPRQPRVGQSQQLEFKNHGSPNAPHQGDTARHPPTQAPWPPWLDKSLARAAKPTSLELLTARERVVFEALASGASARQISRELGITETTTRKHLQHIYAKLGVHDRLSAVLAHPARLDSDPKII
ncbi:response regulator transcription factor [Terrabacter sp. 2RAF25]|uniref:helix-turn-helix transcriptional regulator n=1 Tax=Terrabacter sp. 2RAF25 TaxID=3232998 RepID=UPI003F9C0FC0